ncbi:MAG TPA: cbb3-type cytochrome c oxidase subunit 3 [Burkholderiaceae bacterium]
MDVNDLRNSVMLLLFLIFGGIVSWAWSGRNRARFDEAQRLPFRDDEPSGGAGHE